MSGFQADTAKLGACGEKVAGMASRVDEIRAKAAGAVVPAVSWGLIGQPIAWTFYRSMMDDFAEFMGQLAEGVQDAGKHLSDSAQAYRAADQAVQDGLAAAARGLEEAK
ncbi:type VII secretion target [Actinosynnema sp. CA-248983]